MYTPHVGRWISQDPAGYVDGPNRYLYVLNNPAGHFDPSGLQCADRGPWNASMCSDCPPCTCNDVHDPATGLPDNFPVGELGRGVAKDLGMGNLRCTVLFKIGDCGFESPGKGRTCAKTVPGEGNQQRTKRVVFICIQSGTSRCVTMELLAHELIHARQICNQAEPGDTLRGECEANETRAYNTSCAARLAQQCISRSNPDYDNLFRQCVRNGVVVSCEQLPQEVKKTCDEIIDKVFGGVPNSTE
jgi:hypothetical protein